jgi:hypothetical protein
VSNRWSAVFSTSKLGLLSISDAKGLCVWQTRQARDNRLVWYSQALLSRLAFGFISSKFYVDWKQVLDGLGCSYPLEVDLPVTCPSCADRPGAVWIVEVRDVTGKSQNVAAEPPAGVGRFCHHAGGDAAHDGPLLVQDVAPRRQEGRGKRPYRPEGRRLQDSKTRLTLAPGSSVCGLKRQTTSLFETVTFVPML